MKKNDLVAATYRHAMRFTAQTADYRKERMGKMGAASPVRRLDPVTMEVIAVDVPASTPARRFSKFRRNRAPG